MTILSRLQRPFPRRDPTGTAPDSDAAVTLLRPQYERMVEISADAIISVDERQRIIPFNTDAESTTFSFTIPLDPPPVREGGGGAGTSLL